MEHGVEATKTARGLDHDDSRKDRGWPHHMLTCMVAHFLRWHLTIRLGQKSPSAYGVAAADGAGAGLTLKHVYEC